MAARFCQNLPCPILKASPRIDINSLTHCAEIDFAPITFDNSGHDPVIDAIAANVATLVRDKDALQFASAEFRRHPDTSGIVAACAFNPAWWLMKYCN